MRIGSLSIYKQMFCAGTIALDQGTCNITRWAQKKISAKINGNLSSNSL